MATQAREPVLSNVGNYDLLEKIADGGMGTVYKGRHRDTGDIVAVKIVATHMAGNEVLLKRFEQEYNAARQLDHPNIVRALEFGDTGSRPFMVMEFVDGESLGRKIEREGRIPEKEAIKIIAQIAQGLHRAHKEKLIHRDVKPDNILVTADGTAKLADLGLVKEVEADVNLTRTGRGLGTPHFMAPEQFKNAKNVDPRCDIYSLGATLYMMVTGDLPFKSTGPLDAYMKKIENKLVPPRQIVPGLSDRIDWAIRRAMSADPDQRPSTCREFVEDLTGRSTRKVQAGEGSLPAQQDIWYLVYQDEEGVAHTVKGTSGGIRRSLKEGLLGDASNIRASRKKSGGFEPLRCFPEFRDLVVLPAATSAPGANRPSRPAMPVSPARAPRRAKGEISADEPTVPQQTSLPTEQESSQMPLIQLGDRPRDTWPAWLQLGILFLLLLASAAAGFFVFFKWK
jgi:eukaryotic-like serine/threonine-protein kinase